MCTDTPWWRDALRYRIPKLFCRWDLSIHIVCCCSFYISELKHELRPLLGEVWAFSKEECSFEGYLLKKNLTVLYFVSVPSELFVWNELFLGLVKMDVLGTARAYIKEMVNLAGPQMKVILMDKETVGFFFWLIMEPFWSLLLFQTTIVSCAFAQSEMMQKEVKIRSCWVIVLREQPLWHSGVLIRASGFTCSSWTNQASEVLSFRTAHPWQCATAI